MAEFNGVSYDDRNFEVRTVYGKECLHYIGKSVYGEEIVIPVGIKDISNMFSNCAHLLTPPAIPDGVEDCDGTFFGCARLEEPPVLPQSVKNTNFMFHSCISLLRPAILPKNIVTYRNMYGRCIRLFKQFSESDPAVLSQLQEKGVATVHRKLHELPLAKCNSFN